METSVSDCGSSHRADTVCCIVCPFAFAALASQKRVRNSTWTAFTHCLNLKRKITVLKNTLIASSGRKLSQTYLLQINDLMKYFSHYGRVSHIRNYSCMHPTLRSAPSTAKKSRPIRNSFRAQILFCYFWKNFQRGSVIHLKGQHFINY